MTSDDARNAIPDDPVGRVGERVRLREATLADAAIVDARDRDPAMAGAFNDFGLPPRKPLVDQLADGTRMVAADRGRLLVERLSDGAIIGDVTWHPVMHGPNERSRVPNIGAALVPEARGQGYGSEAQRLLAELLFELFEVERVDASTDVDNVAEQRSLERAGFTREGVLRRAQYRAGGYHDMVVYAIVRGDLRGADADPVDRHPG